MKIAQVAPLMERVPPARYGGTERVVSYLTEELLALGHEVTLFASGNSVTEAELVAPCPEALRLSSGKVDPVAAHAYQLELVASRARTVRCCSLPYGLGAYACFLPPGGAVHDNTAWTP